LNSPEGRLISGMVDGTFGVVSPPCEKLKLLREKALSWLDTRISGFATKLSEKFIFWPVLLTPKRSFGFAWSKSLEKGPWTV